MTVNKGPAPVLAKTSNNCEHEFIPLVMQFGILDNAITLEGEQDELIFQAGIPATHANAALITHVRCHKCGLNKKSMEIQNGNTRFII